MSRPGTLPRFFLCAFLALMLLTPWLAWAAGGQDCSCGMKKSACFCDLLARRAGKHGGCAGIRGTCSLRSPLPAEQGSPRLSFDPRARTGSLPGRQPGFEPATESLAVAPDPDRPRSLSTPPDPPPPRRSASIS